MKAMKSGWLSGLMALGAAAALVACGGGGGGDAAVAPAAPPVAAAGSGALQVSLTDAPACGFDQVNITVDRVRVHASATASDNDAGWKEIVVNPARKIDLLSLQNGVLVDLGQTTLAAGQYTQMRLVLVPNGTKAMSNSVKPTGGTETEIDTPSATQSGLKLINGFTIEANKTTALVLDFDACKSIVQRGNGTYMLKPVIQMMGMTMTGISGYVQTGLPNVTVTAQKGGVVIKATQPDMDGRFVLAPLDPAKGPYDVVIAGPTLTTSVIAAVPVTAEQVIALNTLPTAMTIPTSPNGKAEGNVGPAAARDTAAVRALQAVGTVAAVEVAHVNVTSATGNYSLTLPTAAPRLVTYATPWTTPITFQPQGGAGSYKLEASATGYTTQLGSAITVTAGSTLGAQNFTLMVAP